MALPIGPAVTFLFTDIEGSTRSERAAGSVAWAALVARHDELLAAAIEGQGGAVVKTEGDAFFAAFDDALSAVTAAVAAQRAVAAEAWNGGIIVRVRMGLHLGEGRLRAARNPGDAEDYVGIDVNYAARIAAAANGGQIVVSNALAEALPANLDDVEGLKDARLVLDGRRAVKDFDEPVPLHRLVVPSVADDPRPLRTTEIPTNLPGDVTSFVGRDVELAGLGEDLLLSRIVTLTGPGGSGKTRLALAAARTSRDRFPHGVWFVDLAAVHDASLLETAIAGSVGVRESADQTVDEALRVYLRDRTALLVLDNLEQLLPTVAERVARLVRAAPELRVLATSREVLRIDGERSYRVPPLDIDAGVAVFLDRARAQRPGLVLDDAAMAAIRAIVARLDGLPLAVELAAARTRLLGPTQILERLGRTLDLGGGARDLPERQRTLRGAIAWSHDLLTPAERRLFARLGVFASGWTVDTAHAVVDPGGDLGTDLVDGLESLADKSLVRVEAADGSAPDEELRFGLHPLLREYALERLDELGERRAVEARFVTECVRIAEAASAEILGQDGEAWLRRLDREDRNLRAVIDWALGNEAPEAGLRIVASTWRWFHQRGRLREGRALLGELLARPGPIEVRVRIAALAAEGGLAYWLDDGPASRIAYEQRLELAESTGDPRLEADARYDLGFVAMVGEDETALRAHEQRAMELYTAAGDEDGILRARQALVLATFLAGDYATARELELTNLATFRSRSSQLQVADSLTLLAGVNWRLGDLDESWLRIQESLALFAAIDSASGLARVIGMAAIIQLSDGDPELGARLAGAAYKLVREKGVMLAPVRVLHLPEPAVLLTARFDEARGKDLMDEGDAMALDDVVATVMASPPTPGARAGQAPDGTMSS